MFMFSTGLMYQAKYSHLILGKGNNTIIMPLLKCMINFGNTEDYLLTCVTYFLNSVVIQLSNLYYFCLKQRIANPLIISHLSCILFILFLTHLPNFLESQEFQRQYPLFQNTEE